MRFEEVELLDDATVINAVKHIAIQHHTEGAETTRIPVCIKMDPSSALGEQVDVPLGSDEAVSVQLDFPGIEDQVKARYTIIGKVVANDVGPLEYRSEDEIKRLNRDFDRWSGNWGGFLKATVTIRVEEGTLVESSHAELAIMEYSAEFDEYGETDGRAIFEDR